MTQEKDLMLLGIHTEGMWWVTLLKKLHKGYIWNRHRSVLSLILQKSTFIHFINHATKFYDGYINYDDRKNIDDDGSVVKPKKKFGNISDSKY